MSANQNLNVNLQG